MTMKRNGSAAPWATAMKAPMPSLATSLGPSTSHLKARPEAMVLAVSARCVGVAWLAGRLAHSLANSTPATKAWAWITDWRSSTLSCVLLTCTCLSVRALGLLKVVV